MADRTTNRSIAVAGILATAAVGVAGTVGSWLIAREDRSNQRALAREARVDDRRADSYLAALQLVERQRLQMVAEYQRLTHVATARIALVSRRRAILRLLQTKPTRFIMGSELDRVVDTELVAFGSSRVRAAYARLREVESSLELKEETVVALRGEGAITLRDRISASLADFEDGEQTLESRVQRELQHGLQ